MLCDRFLKLLSGRVGELAHDETFKRGMLVYVGNDAAIDVSNFRSLKLFYIREDLVDWVLAGLLVARPFEFNDDDRITCPLAAEAERVEKYNIRLFFGGRFLASALIVLSEAKNS